MSAAIESTIDPSLLERRILHVDMDAFYAAIEIRDNPTLKGKPVVVGGTPKGRGVVLTSSYEARRYGIKSATPAFQAIRLCPHAVFVRPRFDAYKEASDQIVKIFLRYSKRVQPRSLDEAFLDVTDNSMGMYASRIARLIRNEVKDTVGITCSAGVAPNRMLAKIASDYRKPDGLTVILPGQVHEFMQTLTVRHIPGVGPASEKRLASQGIRLCSDVWKFESWQLSERFGNFGSWLYDRSRGIDRSEVTDYHRPRSGRKSYGNEQTLRSDVSSIPDLEKTLHEIADRVSRKLIRHGRKGKTITLKLKYSDFQRISRAETLATATNTFENLSQISCRLLNKTMAGSRKVRLLGISVSNIEEEEIRHPQRA